MFDKLKEKYLNLEQKQLKELFATNEIAITKEGKIVYFAFINIPYYWAARLSVLKVDYKCKCERCKKNNVTFETFLFLDYLCGSELRLCATSDYVVGYYDRNLVAIKKKEIPFLDKYFEWKKTSITILS
jgi:hypothetical protein